MIAFLRRPWHSFSNSEAFLIRVWSVPFLSAKPRSGQTLPSPESNTILRLDFSCEFIKTQTFDLQKKILLHQEKDALPYPRKPQKTNQPTPHLNKKPKQKTQASPHEHTQQTSVTATISLYSLIIIIIMKASPS